VTAIKVKITRFVCEDQPGFVAFEFADANGRQWQFIEKAPIVSVEDLTRTTKYPKQGFLDVEVIGRRTNSENRDIVHVDTSKPWGVDSVEGVNKFEVLEDSLVEL
jgi:hypothetical protein